MSPTGDEVTVTPRRLPQELINMIVASLRGKLRKESLANCSLVCKSWTPISSKYLFEESSWPCRFRGESGCEDGSGIGCFVRLREVLSSCSRISNAICMLHLVPHTPRCLERGSVTIPLLLQIFDALPHLHTAKLPSIFCAGLSPGSEVEPRPLSLPSRSLKELHIEVDSKSIDAAFDLLSAFAQITKLKLRHLIMPDAGRPRTYPPSPTLQVQSLAISGAGRTPVLEALRGLIDFNAVHCLSLISFPPDTQLTLAPLIQSMASLTSLEYLVSESVAPNWPPANFRPHSLSLVVTVPIRCPCFDSDIGLGGEGLLGMGSGSWGYAMRDLELMVTADTRNVGITLIVLKSPTHVNSKGNYKHGGPEGLVMVQEKTFSRLDWKRLESVAQRWPSIETLKLMSDYRNGAVRPAECTEILRKTASRCLSSTVVGKLLIQDQPTRTFG